MDVVVTVPKDRWDEWIAEGDLPGEPWSGRAYGFYLRGARPRITPGERVYIVAHGKLRGYAPLLYIDEFVDRWSLARRGGAVAVTILGETETPAGEGHTRPVVIRGFRGWRYRWWQYQDESPFPEWRTP